MTERPATLSELLAGSAARFGERLAVASRVGLRTQALSYAELHAASEAVAARLIRDQGLRMGDRVLIWAPGGAQMVAVFFGLLRAGLVAVPLDQNSTPEFVAAVYRKTEAAAIILPERAASPAGLRRIAMEQLEVRSTAREASLPRPEPDEIAEIVFTSGTTGDPKGVVLTHANIVADVLAAATIVPAGVTLDLVSILPLSHMFEQTAGLFLPLYTGGSVHYAPSLRPSAILGEMRRRQVRGMVVVPRFLQLLMGSLERRMEERRLGWLWRLQNRLAARAPMALRRLVFLPQLKALGGGLEFFLCGGAALSAGEMLAWERLGIRVIEGYGATECAPVIASNNFSDRQPGTVGRPLEHVEIRISDEGELLVRGPNVFSAYWRDAATTERAFTEDGWFRTGDMAEMVPDVSLKISGRLSDRIVLPSGMKVYPEDVEAALLVHPAVRECAVIDRADAAGQDSVHAVICPAPGADEAAVAGAVERANQSLASHQRILGFTIRTEDLPRTPLQKLRRAALKKQLADTAAPQMPPPRDPAGTAGAILRKVAQAYAGEITLATRLDGDLGLDSLARVELASVIEQDTGRELLEEQVNALVTAGDLARLLETPLAQTEPMVFPRWPRTGGAAALRVALQTLALMPLHRHYARPFSVTGTENLGQVLGPSLFVANHSSHADTVAILRALPTRLRRKTAIAAAADYFFASRIGGVVFSLLLNAFPFSREGRIRESLEQCGILCDEGWSILIFPEGTRSPDGRLLPFKSGIGLLSTGLNVPVVPISVTGGAQVLKKGGSWPRRGAMTVHFGRPVILAAGTGVEEATKILQQAVAASLPSEMKTKESQNAK